MRVIATTATLRNPAAVHLLAMAAGDCMAAVSDFLNEHFSCAL